MKIERLTELENEQRERESHYDRTIRVCNSTACQSAGSAAVLKALRDQTRDRGILKTCVKGVGCMGLCSAGPLVEASQSQGDPTLYRQVTTDDVPELLEHIVADTPLERLRQAREIPFFQRQHRVVLEFAGRIDPEQLDEYLTVGGYQALIQALSEMSPESLIKEVMASGIRGRGGAGYPTGLKWSTVAKASGSEKFVICNADEGDPGAFMDRSILESNPHRVLEGMILAGYAVGAAHGYVYVRAEYPLAVERLTLAIKQATNCGLLGRKILDTDFDFDIELRQGAGAFVCGEETALMASVEGQRGQPHPRPPYPAEHGLWGCPTLINNVETFANIPNIILRGGGWFASIGTPASTGTKLFALTGRIRNIGLIEVPMGITLREIIEEIGGGIPNGRRFKAVQTGGPSGGCLPESCLDMTVEYDTLRAAGSIMGSGGMIVIDDSSSMVEVARYFMEFCMLESCGKCVPCRVGTFQMHRLLDQIARRAGTSADLALLEELCEVVQSTSLCGLGQTAPNPVLSTLRYFREEYLQLLDSSVPAVTG